MISCLTCGGQQGQCSQGRLWGQIVCCPNSTNPGAREAKREQHAAPSAAKDASAYGPPILERWQESPGVSCGPGKVSGEEVYVTSDSSSALAHREVQVPHPTSPGSPNRDPEFRGDRMVPNTFSHPI